MEVVADLFHASYGVMRQLMKTSQVSRANGTTHTHQSSMMKEGLLFLYHLWSWSHGAWRLLLTYSMLHLGSWDRLMKTSQVSRANGTTHTHQSSVMKEGAFSMVARLVCTCDGMASLPWTMDGGCCWLIPCFIWGHETGWWRLHKSLGPMEPLILTNLQWWRRGLFSLWQLVSVVMVWHHFIMDMEIWRLLLTYSMLHLGSWDRLMKTSQVSRANGTTHTHQSSMMKEGLLCMAAI